MRIRGVVRIDNKTKDLLKRLRPGDIAVINHEDLDEVAAHALVEKRVRAVLNARLSTTGRYPTPGPGLLLRAGIPVIDDLGPGLAARLTEGEEVEIQGNRVFRRGEVLGKGTRLTEEILQERMEGTKANLERELERFLSNTLEYAQKEKDLVLGRLPVPEIRTSFAGRHALVVVRGQNYREDLLAIKSYIDELKPVLVGVDGGADALVDFGYRPDLIVGDMDSVSDHTLKSGAELVVHAYPDGHAPGMKRLKRLGLAAVTFPAPGTSEDIAMLLAHEKGAALIVAVGTHSNIIDFLEKGRKGMASTLLVRMKIGSVLVDARGVSRLYRGSLRTRYLLGLVIAGAVPAALIAALAPPTQHYLRLLLIKFRLLAGL